MAKVLITGNTFPVKEELKALGARWDADQKGWMVPEDKAAAAQAIVAGAPKGSTGSTRSYRPNRCKVCGAKGWDGVRGHQGEKILRSGECVGCYEERKMGY